MEENQTLGELNINDSIYKTRISKKFSSRKAYAPADPKKILSFIPGTVLEIHVKEGQKVKKGENLLILEAMKMQNNLKCPVDGKVSSIAVKQGAKVAKGTLLIELE